MAENIGGPSAPYNTTIPSITDNADIQTALRLYHYGANTSTPTVIPEESIAGHLNVLANAKIDKVPFAIPASANLNDYTITGYYAQTSNSFASDGTNYPSPYAGMLTVSNSGGSIFQQYQVVGASETGSATNTLNRAYWRFYFAGAWRPWRTYVDSTEFASLGDARYYTQSAANAIFASQNYVNATFFTKVEAETSRYVQEVPVTDTAYTLQITDAGKVIHLSANSDTVLTIPTNTQVPFPIGTIINVYTSSASNMVVSATTGVVLRPFSNNKFKLFEQYTEISLRKRATNEWVGSGNFLEA